MDRGWLLRLAYPWACRYWRLTRPITLGARALVIADDRLLLVRHSYGARQEWTIPGGAVARGETLVAAALRELAEECGVQGCAADDPLLGIYYHHREGKHDHVAVVICHAPQQALRPGGPEILEAAWHPLHALPPVPPGILRCLADYHRGARGQSGPW